MSLFPDIVLEFCSREDQRYKTIRDEHYVPNKGEIGRQIQFIIWRRREKVGIITAGSAVKAVGARDKFFGITKANRKEVIQQIVNNTVCRLIVHERGLMQEVLSIWRKVVPFIWFDLYATEPIAFETFVGEAVVREGESRDGHSYKGDNWQFLGKTKGVAKHTKGGKVFSHVKTDPKLIFARRCDDFSWMHSGYGIPKRKSSFPGKTSEEKRVMKQIAARRKYLRGKAYYMQLTKRGWVVALTPIENVLQH